MYQRDVADVVVAAAGSHPPFSTMCKKETACINNSLSPGLTLPITTAQFQVLPRKRERCVCVCI